ncbi:MAG: argininosuccinate lyase, partial [Actinomycetota bacterium]
AVVGSLVRRSLAGEGSLAELVRAEPRLGAAAAELLAPGVAVRMRTTPGGAGPAPFGEQLAAYRRFVQRWSVTVQELESRKAP